MKILMINTVPFQRNGITTNIMNYCIELHKMGMKIDIGMSGNVDSELEKELKKNNIRTKYYGDRKSNPILYMINVYKNIRKEKYDIVHVHGNSNTMFFDLFPARIAGCKIRIAHSHNTTCEHMRLHKMLQIPFNISYNVGFACGYEAGRWLFGNKKFHIINNGIDLKTYEFNAKKRQKLRQELNLTDNELLLGHVGLFNEQKNHEYLIGILKKLKRDKCNCKMICVGDGENRPKIEKLAKEYRLEKQIIFTGQRSNVADYLQAIDLFLLPSRYEGLPYVLIEAQAMGLSCIVADTVDKKVDIIGNIQFESLEKIESWCFEIEQKSMNIINNNVRRQLSEKAHNSIRKHGYDIHTNAQEMAREYRRFKKIKKDI